MALQFDTTTRNSMADALAARVDGGTAAIINIYTGSPPGIANAASGTLLATLTMSATAFAAASGGVLDENTITSDSSADASGTPGYFRVLTQSGGTAIIEGTAAVGSGDLNFNSAISSGGIVAITNFAITVGNA